MERRHVSDATMLPGFDGLMFHRYFPSTADGEPETAESNRFYESYHRIHKVFVGESGSRLLKTIHEGLKDEQHPEYLDTAGWAAVESALVDESADTIARLRLIESAEQCWERAIMAQADINERLPDDEVEDDSTFRLALNLAFTPIMKALVVGNVTTSVREQVFADVLALGQLAGIQRDLASKDGHIDAAAQLLGFEHECNAHLVLLFINDPRYLPLPSSSRGGERNDVSGADSRHQRHQSALGKYTKGRAARDKIQGVAK
jgi:hypothetical protein